MLDANHNDVNGIKLNVQYFHVKEKITISIPFSSYEKKKKLNRLWIIFKLGKLETILTSRYTIFYSQFYFLRENFKVCKKQRFWADIDTSKDNVFKSIERYETRTNKL